MVIQTRTKSTGKLTRETIRKIIDEIDECDAYCLDYMYEVGRPLDPNLYGECIDKCFLEISKKYNVPIEKINEIERTLGIDPLLMKRIVGDGG